MLVEDDARVTLLVHQVRPPFLDGRVSFSNIREAVATVKDASSDFAKMAREGSATLRHLRETKVNATEVLGARRQSHGERSRRESRQDRRR